MTARELRQMLFEVENQNLTVKELRQLLFTIDNQNEELTAETVKNVTNTERGIPNA